MPYAEYRPEFTDFADAVQRGTYDEMLLDAWLPLAPGLADRLAAGAQVADIGCGTGHSTNLLARAYPRSAFVGYDISEDAIEVGRAEAAEYVSSNVTFEVLDVALLPAQSQFDAVSPSIRSTTWLTPPVC